MSILKLLFTLTVSFVRVRTFQLWIFHSRLYRRASVNAQQALDLSDRGKVRASRERELGRFVSTKFVNRKPFSARGQFPTWSVQTRGCSPSGGWARRGREVALNYGVGALSPLTRVALPPAWLTARASPCIYSVGRKYSDRTTEITLMAAMIDSEAGAVVSDPVAFSSPTTPPSRKPAKTDPDAILKIPGDTIKRALRARRNDNSPNRRFLI